MLNAQFDVAVCKKDRISRRNLIGQRSQGHGGASFVTSHSSRSQHVLLPGSQHYRSSLHLADTNLGPLQVHQDGHRLSEGFANLLQTLDDRPMGVGSSVGEIDAGNIHA